MIEDDLPMSEKVIPRSYIPQDWRIRWGVGLTIFWFIFLTIYIARNVGWGSFLDLPINDMGAFLEGAFAFLAFLWLVIGLFIQQAVLAQNNEELRRNNLHSEKQTQAIAATELNPRQRNELSSSSFSPTVHPHLGESLVHGLTSFARLECG